MKKKSKQVTPELLRGHRYPRREMKISPYQAILYHSGIGFSQEDPLKDLQFTYEGHPNFNLFPTSAVLLSSYDYREDIGLDGFPEFNPTLMLQAE